MCNHYTEFKGLVNIDYEATELGERGVKPQIHANVSAKVFIR